MRDVLLATAASLFAVASGPVWAQSNAPEAGNVDDIIVTANRRRRLIEGAIDLPTIAHITFYELGRSRAGRIRSFASLRPISAFRSSENTIAPAATKARTADSPMPCAPPVTMIRLPVKLTANLHSVAGARPDSDTPSIIHPAKGVLGTPAAGGSRISNRPPASGCCANISSANPCEPVIRKRRE